jgi:hypothetical protein
MKWFFNKRLGYPGMKINKYPLWEVLLDFSPFILVALAFVGGLGYVAIQAISSLFR